MAPAAYPHEKKKYHRITILSCSSLEMIRDFKIQQRGRDWSWPEVEYQNDYHSAWSWSKQVASLLKTNVLDSIFTLSTNCKYFDLFQLQKHSKLALFLCISKVLSSRLHSSFLFVFSCQAHSYFWTDKTRQFSWPQTPNRSE